MPRARRRPDAALAKCFPATSEASRKIGERRSAAKNRETRMSQIQPLLIVVVGFAITIGLPIGLYVLFTRGRRRAMREIRRGAEAQGWRYPLPHGLANPTAFRIHRPPHSRCGCGTNSPRTP